MGSSGDYVERCMPVGLEGDYATLFEHGIEWTW